MKIKSLQKGPQPTYMLVFEPGEEFTATLLEFARAQNIQGAHFTALGAFQNSLLAFFDPNSNEYVEYAVDQQMEVASLTGNISMMDGDWKIHAHAVLSDLTGSVRAGHLVEGYVRPTLELALAVGVEALKRKLDPGTGLTLLDFTECD